MPISKSDFYAMQLRCRPKTKEIPSEGVERESDLHDDISQECLRRGWLAFHGSMAHKTYRTKGEPDFICVTDDGRILFIECKTKSGKLTTEQEGIKLWLKKLGWELKVIRSFREFLTVADEREAKHGEGGGE